MSKQYIYRVNSKCPGCGEDHMVWNISISEDDKKRLDKYYDDMQSMSSMQLALEEYAHSH